MSKGKHRATHRAPRRRIPLRASHFAAPVVTSMAVGLGVLAQAQDPEGLTTAVESNRSNGALDPLRGADSSAEFVSSGEVTGEPLLDRTVSVSRSSEREELSSARKFVIDGHLWTIRDLDLRLTPASNAQVDGEVESDTKVAVTGRSREGYTEVLIKGSPRWVTSEYLAEERDPVNQGISTGGCPGTSGVMAGLTDGADRVYMAVCNAFPEITTYGGRDPHGEHRTGKAIDIMTSDVALGTRIAEFLRAHAGELNLNNVIWRQRIWTPVRAAEGWRPMSNRGSATANHYDHVHVSVN